ncbi:MAG TPA: ABC transporter substrate-binding protein [Streptosporangiaceae bacterium]|nr:ABC transporter substrate-binding protein [Streptosporangiaceae bacterium]
MRRSLLAAGVAALTVLAAAGCSSSAATSSGRASPVVLRLGFLANITHEPALVGLENGFFAKNLGKGVTLKTTVFSSGTEETTALLAGQQPSVGVLLSADQDQSAMAATISIMTVILVLGIAVDMIFTRVDTTIRRRRGMLDPAAG